jgi:hypothetical protein
MKSKLLAAVDNGMAGIVATLVTNDVIVVAGDEVSDLALSLIAPLGAYQHCAWHDSSFPLQAARQPAIITITTSSNKNLFNLFIIIK